MPPDADRQLEILLGLTPFMITRCSLDLRYLFVSDAYARMLGRPAKDITGRHVREVIGDEGRIEAESDGPGYGSRFTVRLPVLAQAPLSAQAPAKVPSRVSRRVLVIDDNRDAADTLALLVTTLGGVAQAAYDGEEGLRRAETFSPEVIFLDIGMPGMDGYETCRRLRARSFGKRAMIVALTGWGQERDRARAFDTGFDAHLTKPADPETLGSLLADIEGGASGSDGASVKTPA